MQLTGNAPFETTEKEAQGLAHELGWLLLSLLLLPLLVQISPPMYCRCY
jgi:hypothetical protein